MGAYSKRVAHPAAFERASVARIAFDAMVAREQHRRQDYAVVLASLAPLEREHTVHRIADRLGVGVRRPYLLNTSSHAGAVAAAALIDHDFAENGSVALRYQIQSEYWAPARVLCRQFSCSCGSCSGGSVVCPVFSERRAAVRMALRRLSEGMHVRKKMSALSCIYSSSRACGTRGQGGVGVGRGQSCAHAQLRTKRVLRRRAALAASIAPGAVPRLYRQCGPTAPWSGRSASIVERCGGLFLVSERLLEQGLRQAANVHHDSPQSTPLLHGMNMDYLG